MVQDDDKLDCIPVFYEKIDDQELNSCQGDDKKDKQDK